MGYIEISSYHITGHVQHNSEIVWSKIKPLTLSDICVNDFKTTLFSSERVSSRV